MVPEKTDIRLISLEDDRHDFFSGIYSFQVSFRSVHYETGVKIRRSPKK